MVIKIASPLFIGTLLLGASACTPRVEVSADKPIEINMNVTIEHHIKVEVDRDLEKSFSKNSDIF